jgi:hypothetical protein
MQRFDLAALIEDALSGVARRRGGQLPQILAVIPPDLPSLQCDDDSLEGFLREVFRVVLRPTSVYFPIRVAVHRRTRLRDLETFVGLSPFYWLQIGISARGLCSFEVLWTLEAILEADRETFGYSCQERIGVQGGACRLAILRAGRDNAPKMVVYIARNRFRWKCEFLIPILKESLPTAA